MPAPEVVVVHPLVLLSVVDHYNRVARDTRKRVVGVLLGEASKGSIQVTNAFGGTPGLCQQERASCCHTGCAPWTAGTSCAYFAVPFEEDDRDPQIWFLDHSYVENMAGMFRRVAGVTAICVYTAKLCCSLAQRR